MVQLWQDKSIWFEGRVTIPKRMNFWKNSKRPLIPPSFSENHVAIFLQITCTKALFTSPKAATSIFGLKWCPPPFKTFPKIHLFLYRHRSQGKHPISNSLLKTFPSYLSPPYHQWRLFSSFKRKVSTAWCDFGYFFLTSNINKSLFWMASISKSSVEKVESESQRCWQCWSSVGVNEEENGWNYW